MMRSSAAFASIIAISLLAGCSSPPDWMKANCGWTGQVLPIKPSRHDKLTDGTARQILAANEAQEANCK